MGQAFRRESGRIRSSSVVVPPQKTILDRRPPVAPAERAEMPKPAEFSDPQDDVPRVNNSNVIEERDPSYDAMLKQMTGRIKSVPGGKLETGEAFVVGKYKRPMPKLRDTKPDTGRYEEQVTPPGTLNIAQVRHIILLHQGKAEDHDGTMQVQDIAEKFHIDAEQIRKILQFVSLPPEDTSKQGNMRQ